MRRIRIIQYNQIGDYPAEAMEDGLHLESLEQQLEYLLSHDYHITGLQEALAYMDGRKDLPENPVALTFDGGFADAYGNVFPLLEKHKIRAAFFIPPALVGGNMVIRGHKLPCMKWEEIKDLAQRGMTIGHYGCNGRAFKRVPREVIEEDILATKPLFEKNLGFSPRYYAVREGVPEPSAIEVLKKNGYRALLTKSPTKQRPNLYAVGRVQVDDDDLNIFLTKISATYLLFKDSRYWKYIRKWSLDKAFHFVSESYNDIRKRLAPRPKPEGC